jgi:predicted  nucleic acid-binding Zn-ribbon protein
MGVRVPPEANDREIVITPRALDQASYDDLSVSLRALIDRAVAVTGELRAAMNEVDGLRDETGQAAVALQERLRVSVRMLKAFQVQIEHIESVLADQAAASRRTEQTLAELDRRIAQAEDRAEAVTRLVESAEVNIAVLAHKTARNAGE